MSGGGKRSGEDFFTLAKFMKASQQETLQEARKNRKEEAERRRQRMRRTYRCSACRVTGHFESECQAYLRPEQWVAICDRHSLCRVCLR